MLQPPPRANPVAREVAWHSGADSAHPNSDLESILAVTDKQYGAGQRRWRRKRGIRPAYLQSRTQDQTRVRAHVRLRGGHFHVIARASLLSAAYEYMYIVDYCIKTSGR